MKEILEKIDKMNTTPYSTEERNFCYTRGINDVRKLILSEQSKQKEPCEYCNWFSQMNVPLPVIYSGYEPIEQPMASIQFCPMCGRELTQSPTNN